MKKFEKINYIKLNPRQQENYNYQKISSVLANYGYTTIKLSADWQTADFIAQHIDGKTFLKVQLKGRLTIDKKYIDKNIWIGFNVNKQWYLYPHDEIANHILENSNVSNTVSWKKKGIHHWRMIPRRYSKLLNQYKID